MPGGRTCVDPEMVPIVGYRGSHGRGCYRLLRGKDSESHKEVQKGSSEAFRSLVFASGFWWWTLVYQVQEPCTSVVTTCMSPSMYGTQWWHSSKGLIMLSGMQFSKAGSTSQDQQQCPSMPRGLQPSVWLTQNKVHHSTSCKCVLMTK